MVAALEKVWAAIRARHPQIPAVVMVLGASSIGTAGGLRLGHFAAMRWAEPDHPDNEPGGGGTGPVRLPEVFVGGEGLARGLAEVLGTLLHEAAHALAHVRGIKDTSRQGRWHNARFKALAEELGIEVTKDGRIGWSPTSIPATTRDAYPDVIDELGRVLRLHRSVEITDGRARKPSPPPCVCESAVGASVSPRRCSPPARSPAGSAEPISHPPATATRTRTPRQGTSHEPHVRCLREAGASGDVPTTRASACLGLIGAAQQTYRNRRCDRLRCERAERRVPR